MKSVHDCLQCLKYVNVCLKLEKHVNDYPTCLKYVNDCLTCLKSVNDRLQCLKSVNDCLQCLEICERLSEMTVMCVRLYEMYEICERLSDMSEICERLFEVFEICERLSEMSKICERLPELFAICLTCLKHQPNFNTLIQYCMYVHTCVILPGWAELANCQYPIRWQLPTSTTYMQQAGNCQLINSLLNLTIILKWRLPKARWPYSISSPRNEAIINFRNRLVVSTTPGRFATILLTTSCSKRSKVESTNR